MSWYDYSDAAEQKAKTQRDLEKRRKRGEKYEAFVAPEGRKLAVNFWGQAWCRHLETYCGYETRLPRGRSYLRAGHVYNLAVEQGVITAEVTGSSLYEVEVRIAPLKASVWAGIKQTCQGEVASLLDLLGGKLGDHVMQVVVDPKDGLFPGPREIRHQCTCPDAADLCKHQAAVLYAVGVLFDRDPRFFFELRGVDPSELIASSAAVLGTAADQAAGDFGGEDLGALFGIELADSETPMAAAAPASPRIKKPKAVAKTKPAVKPRGPVKKKAGPKKKPA
jgi:uncharacterized Zn finger protein